MHLQWLLVAFLLLVVNNPVEIHRHLQVTTHRGWEPTWPMAVSHLGAW